jgi:DNA-binding NtrC family response regulator
LLAGYFIKKFSADFSKTIRGLTQRALIVLERHPWPGNVRELEHVIGRACMMADSRWIDVAELPQHLVYRPIDPITVFEDAPLALAQQERRLVEQALLGSKGNQSEAARSLGIGRDALRYKMKMYALSSRKTTKDPQYTDAVAPDQLALPGIR